MTWSPTLTEGKATSYKKRRKSLMDEFFGGSLFGEMDEVSKRFEKGERSSGYSISVTQTPEGTKVHAKGGKDTDVGELRRRLTQQYPGAQIEIEGGKPLIREISTRPVEENEKESSS